MKFYLCVKIQSTCTVLALSFPHESAWSPPAAAVLALGAPKDQGSFRGTNDEKRWFLGLDGAPASWALLPWESLASGAQKSGSGTIWHQTKQGLGLYTYIYFFFPHSQFYKISKWLATEEASSLTSCSVKGGASFSSMPVHAVWGMGMQMFLQLTGKAGWEAS